MFLPRPRHLRRASIAWAVAGLQAPTVGQVRLALRVGIDPNRLLDRFREQFVAASVKDGETIRAIAGGDLTRECGLWDEVNAIALARRQAWHERPALAVARLSGATSADVAGLAAQLGRSRYVGHRVVRRGRIRHRSGSAVLSAGRPLARPRGAGRPRVRVARRLSAASAGSDDGPGSSPPPVAGRLDELAGGPR